MNISSSNPTAAAGTVPPAAAGPSPGSETIAGKDVKLIESGAQQGRETWESKRPQSDALAKRTQPSPTGISARIEPELEGLIMTSGDKGGNFMGKMRSLARNTMKMFACTSPNQQHLATSYSTLTAAAHSYQQQQDAGQRAHSPYSQFAEKLTLTGADEIVTYMNLGLLDDFHNGARAIPQISRQIAESDRSSLAAQLSQKPPLLQAVLVPAAALESVSEGTSAYSIVKANPEISAKKSDLLAQHIQEATLAATGALEESYTPQNPQLQQLVARLPEGATKLHQFASSENNPYQALSSSEHFTGADDRHLRNWLNSGLQVLDKGARIIEAVLIDQNPSLTIMGDLYQFTHLDEPGVANQAG